MTSAETASSNHPSYAITTTVPLSVDAADAAVREALKAEGFGVLTEIDVKATLKEKLDADIQPYRILGACAPPLAHEAIQREASVGLLLPCNVVVRQGSHENESVVQALDPVVQLGVAESDTLRSLAEEVRGRMARVIEAVGGKS